MAGRDERSGEAMRIAVIGHGRMGRLVEQLAGRQGIEVGLVLDGSSNRAGRGLTRESLAGIDVAIDFSRPDCAFENARRVIEQRTDLVIGTTGWYERLGEVREAAEAASSGVVHGPNFSPGANLFFAIIESAAALMQGDGTFEPYLLEKHHKAKLDSPSGTTTTLQGILSARYPGDAIPHAVLQAGYTAGLHEVGFDSPSETVVVQHLARKKDANALGALAAARWIRGRTGCYSFREFVAQSALERGLPAVSSELSRST